LAATLADDLTQRTPVDGPDCPVSTADIHL